MSTQFRLASFAAAVVVSLFCHQSSHAQFFLESSFPAGLGTLNGIGFDSDTQTIYVHANFSSVIEMFDETGASVGSVPDPGSNGNDSDYFFSKTPTNIGGTSIPAGALLAIEHESGTALLIAADALTGAVLATQDLTFVTGRLVGGTLSSATGTFFAVDYQSNVVYEFAGDNGALLNTFSVGAGFDVFYGDIEYNHIDGNLYIVSDSQDVIRVVDPSGNIVVDLDVSLIGVTDMSGISFDHTTGTAWICSTNGTVYQMTFSAYVVAPNDFRVSQGTYTAGMVADITASDNADLSVRRSATDVLSRTEFTVDTNSPFESPITLQLRLEGSVFARSEVLQAIDLYNFETGSWEEVDVRKASRFVDRVDTVDIAGSVSRFVEAETLLMRARVHFRSSSPRMRFTSNSDQFTWTMQLD